ncbi:hypothetical protein FRB99_000054 [Tulasnella sp. 403]|nr:hypothetical protein FRB99_000054 [Tulasnella sp. 403]
MARDDNLSSPDSLADAGIAKPSFNDPHSFDFRQSEQAGDRKISPNPLSTSQVPSPEPTHTIDSSGNAVSQDARLNRETLYHFLTSQAAVPPSFKLECYGSHTERLTRTVTHKSNGNTVKVEEPYYETEACYQTVTDFQFTIDLSPLFPPHPQMTAIWLAADSTPAYRGGASLEVDEKLPDIVFEKVECGGSCRRRKATAAEISQAEAHKSRLDALGLPRWTATAPPDMRRHYYRAAKDNGGIMDDSVVPSSLMTLRTWADEYCRSGKALKEFQFRKDVYGWDLADLRQKVCNTIRANYGREEEPRVDFVVEASRVTIQSDSRLSRMLANTWIYVLLWATLIYPLFIWPYRRLNGGKSQVAGSAFRPIRWKHLEDSYPGQTAEEYVAMHDHTPSLPESGRLRKTHDGVSELVNCSAEEWFTMWEETIATLVKDRHASRNPISSPLVSVRADKVMKGNS